MRGGIRLGIGLGVAFLSRLFGKGGLDPNQVLFGSDPVAWGADVVGYW